MTAQQLISFALASAISAELGLYGLYLLFREDRRAPAQYLMAGLTLCLALIFAGNLLVGVLGVRGLAGFVLALDLFSAPLLFLYVRQMRLPAPELRWRDLALAVPALLVLAARAVGWLGAMDVVSNIYWLAYLGSSIFAFASNPKSYAPAPRVRYLATLLSILGVVSVLRVLMAVQAADGQPFVEGIPYLALLIVIFLATCQLILATFRYPDLLSVPGSHLKYGRTGVSQVELDALDRRLGAYLAEAKPFLEPELTVADVAEALGVSARTLSQLVNARYGMNFAAYMNTRRIDFAAGLLSERREMPIKVVMHESGFRSKSLFNEEFRRHKGVTPSEYRQRAIGDSEAAL